MRSIKEQLQKALHSISKRDTDDKIDDDDAAVASIYNADAYFEQDPTVGEFLREIVPSARDVGRYVYNLFPFIQWIGKYNVTWLIGDAVAGITVGAVVVPQSMAYALLAQLPVEYGLYSSFMGVLIYWFFATSKDITIGPVAVMSQVTGNVVLHARDVLPDVPGHVVASALALVCGAIISFLGLARVGWVVELIPLPAICAFMTGSAVSIMAGQAPKLLGIPRVNTRAAPYRVLVDTLRGLPRARLDAALGLSSLLLLYAVRGACARLAARQPRRAKTYFFLSTLRTVFVILLYTAVSAAVNAPRRQDPAFSVIGSVPRGFQHARVPRVDSAVLGAFASEIPAAIIVMLIEHIAISKSFGRLNNYVIDPSQELVAIGVTNVVASFLGAYPATGSFSRTAIKSKAGVRTPLAGVITAAVVLLAVYALTSVFFYIPNAALAGVIIHAVGDVITPPRVVVQFWRVSPIEAVVFFAGVVVTVFSTIEYGIYTTVCASFAVVLWRLFLSQGRLLGVARIRTAVASTPPNGEVTTGAKDGGGGVDGTLEEQQQHAAGASEKALRTGFLPLHRQDGSNPKIDLRRPHPGVYVYRFTEGFNYPNATRHLNHLTETIFKETRRTDMTLVGKVGDRAWNDPTPRHVDPEEVEAQQRSRPVLRAVVLDFSAVNNIDITAAQALIDVRNQLDRYAAPGVVDWHFAHVENRWARRALAAAGFGYPSPRQRRRRRGDARWKTIFSIADVVDGGNGGGGGGGGDGGGSSSSSSSSNGSILLRDEENELGIDGERKSSPGHEVWQASASEGGGGGGGGDGGGDKRDGGESPAGSHRRLVAVRGMNRPFFHLDLQEAVEAAISNAEAEEG